jgi:glycosyltransferase involved in cell wall biosynthesis
MFVIHLKNPIDYGQQITEKKPDTALSDVLLLIPTLNEQEAIQQLIREAQTAGFADILVVDGFSSDNTRDVAASMKAKVVLQEFGKGKGCGVRTGMKLFLERDSNYLSIIDGDETNIPSDLARMVHIAKSGNADVILGSRTRGKRDKGSMPALSLASNLTVSFLLGAKFLHMFTDVQTGYWLFTREAIRRIYPKLQSTSFEVELELFVKIMKEGLRVAEIPVGFRKRKGKTKFSFRLRLRNLYYAFMYLAS